jgi:hypothetical protein
VTAELTEGPRAASVYRSNIMGFESILVDFNSAATTDWDKNGIYCLS